MQNRNAWGSYKILVNKIGKANVSVSQSRANRVFEASCHDAVQS